MTRLHMTPSSAELARELQDAPPPPPVIVVAVDRSSSAAYVLATALRIMRSMPAATLHVVHVFRTSRLDHGRGVPPTPATVIEDAKEQHLEAHVRTARRERRGEVMGHFLFGDPAAEILRLSSSLKADMLIVGTHDHQGLERLLLGSIAETIMRKASCNVYVVRRTPDSDQVDQPA
jgi:nucleotide-binding universal stress UspA family protein